MSTIPAPHKLYLLDAMALVYRAHFAMIMKPIINSKGVNTSAVFGFTNTLLLLLEKEKPTHMAVVFDTSAPTPRHEVFPAYKAQREEMPEDLRDAIPVVKRLVEAFRIPVLAVDGLEADDVIGILATQAEARGDFETYMVTPDKDFAQLVSERTRIYKPGRQGSDVEILDVAKVCEQWLVQRPEQVIDVLALMGDSVDNIPGVPGIGEKTAKALIQEFHTVEELTARVNEVKGKRGEVLKENLEKLKLYKELTTIITDAPLPKGLDDLKILERDDEAVKELCRELEFKGIGMRLFGADFNAGRGFTGELDFGELKPAAPVSLRTLADVKHHYRLAKPGDAQAFFGKTVGIAGKIGRDVDGLPTLEGLAVCPEKGEGVYFPVGANLPEELRSLLEDTSTIRIGYDCKPLVHALLWLGGTGSGEWRDIMLAQFMTDPDQKQSLTYMAESLLGYTPRKPSDGGGETVKQTGAQGDFFFALMDDGSALEAALPCLEQADLCLQLWPQLEARLNDSGQLAVFTNIETPTLPVLAMMEKTGVSLATEVLQDVSKKLGALEKDLEAKIHLAAGFSFNVASPKQLGVVLFEKLKLLEKPKKTKTGQYQTGEEILSELEGIHPIVSQILEYREASKLKSTYADALPAAIARRSKRVHTTFQQAATATGRLASSGPNLQNIPIRTAQGREIRKAFVAGPSGWQIVSADYSQIELRIMAALSGDPSMREAFEQDLDIHTATAAKVYGVALAEVTSEMRRTAKMVNFGIIYGISGFGLGQRLGMARKEAQQVIDDYFTQYPAVQKYMQGIIEQTKQDGYIGTLSGRRRQLRDIRSANATVRKGAERMAINTPIQGTAADMMKLAMARVADRLKAEGLQSRLLLQVHDELVLESPKEEYEALRTLLMQEMSQALPIGLPVKVEVGCGPSWEEAH
jgi:DNA polymerase I